jgi:hypothetical protein
MSGQVWAELGQCHHDRWCPDFKLDATHSTILPRTDGESSGSASTTRTVLVGSLMVMSMPPTTASNSSRVRSSICMLASRSSWSKNSWLPVIRISSRFDGKSDACHIDNSPPRSPPKGDLAAACRAPFETCPLPNRQVFGPNVISITVASRPSDTMRTQAERRVLQGN